MKRLRQIKELLVTSAESCLWKREPCHAYAFGSISHNIFYLKAFKNGIDFTKRQFSNISIYRKSILSRHISCDITRVFYVFSCSNNIPSYISVPGDGQIRIRDVSIQMLFQQGIFPFNPLFIICGGAFCPHFIILVALSAPTL